MKIKFFLLSVIIPLLFISSCNSTQQYSDGYIAAGLIWGGINTSDFIYENPVLVKLDTQGKVEWERIIEEWEWIHSIQKTNDGGFIACGYDLSQNNIFMLKLNTDGQTEWRNNYDGVSLNSPISAVQTPDNGYIMACTKYLKNEEISNRICLTKLTSNGDIEWEETYGNAYGWGQFVQKSLDGGYILSGTIFSQAGVYSSQDIYIAKLNENGAILWEKTLFSEGQDNCYSLNNTSDGGVIFLGSATSKAGLIKLDKNGNITWEKQYEFTPAYYQPVKQTFDKGYMFFIYNSELDSGGLIKADTNGEIIWEKYFQELTGSTDNERVNYYPICETDEGYIMSFERYTHKESIVNGVTSPVTAQEIVVTKFDFNGKIEWSTVHELPIKEGTLY